MDGSPTDNQLIEITSGAPPATIAEVIARMQRIDTLLPNGDGLKWFNLLYMTVTQKVDSGPPPGGWEDSAWLTRLDVVFAQLYFTAILNWVNDPANVPSSWKALFEARFSPGIERIQFALAGMNAHINRDLSLALLTTDAQRSVVPTADSPQHVDYEAVNGLLNTVMPSALTMLAADTLGVLAQDTGKVGRLLAFWNMCQARDMAWDFADHLRGLASVPRGVAMDTQDQMTGVIGRAILAVT